MKRDWRDFKAMYGNIAGAREAFEGSCEKLFRAIHKEESVHQIAVKKGDGGIDIFVGEFGIEPIKVIQCKFFLESFGEAQKQQIRESYKTAIQSDKYVVEEWILCIPNILDIDDMNWWSKWKNEKIEETGKKATYIQLKDGNELIDLMQQYDLYNEVFQIEDSLKIDAIYRQVVPRHSEKVKGNTCSKISDVLFNNYTKKNEKYYVVREQDNEFNESIKIGNVWVYGSSGVGKTTLINRNLIQNNLLYCYCDLSPVKIDSSEDVLKEIIYTIENTYDIKNKIDELSSIKKIVNLLLGLGYKHTVIVIDELAVYDIGLLKDISNDLMRIVTTYNNKASEKELKFIISTIRNPLSLFENKSKPLDYFHFISCEDWQGRIQDLLEIIKEELELDLRNQEGNIIENSCNSPRIVKSILKKIVICECNNEDTIQHIIRQTVEEAI